MDSREFYPHAPGREPAPCTQLSVDTIVWLLLPLWECSPIGGVGE